MLLFINLKQGAMICKKKLSKNDFDQLINEIDKSTAKSLLKFNFIMNWTFSVSSMINKKFLKFF